MISEICLNCFKIKGNYDVCKYCGWIEGTQPEQAYHLNPGTVLAERYTIGTVVKFGGFGVVYKAFDTQLETVVAIKELYPPFLVSRIPGESNISVFSGEKEAQFRDMLNRFLEEAKYMAKFSNRTDIVQVYTYFEENKTAYIVMELLDGESLSNYLKRNGGTIDAQEAVKILDPALQALSAMHAEGIVHRDLKPGHIHITSKGQTKILDFGAAIFSSGKEEAYEPVLTPGYAAPEQYRTKSRQGPYTDIYAMGVVLYKMITGVIPDESIDRQVEDNIKKPSELGIKIDHQIENTIMKSLALKPELRFQSAEQFRQAILEKRKVVPLSVEIFWRRAFRIGVATIICAISLIIFLVGMTSNKDPLGQVAEDKISIWIPVQDSSGSDAISGMKAIETEFEKSYSQLKLDIVSVKQSEYEQKLQTAFVAGNSPSLFNTESSYENLKDRAASLKDLIHSIKIKDYVLFPEYKKLYPSQLEIPLGFQLTVLYANNQAATSDGQMIPSEITSWKQLIDSNPSFAVQNDSIGSLIYLYDNSLLHAGKLDMTESVVQKIIDLKHTAVQSSGDSSLLQQIQNDKLAYLIADTSLMRTIQKSLPGYYSLISLSNQTHFQGKAAERWAVSRYASVNQKKAAMLLLRYLLNDYSQNELFLQRDSVLPINKSVLSQYITANSDLSFLHNFYEKIIFNGESTLVLHQLGTDIYKNILQKDISDAQIRDYLNNYKN